MKVCGGEALEGVPHHGEGEQRGEVPDLGEGEADLTRRRRVRHLVAAHVQLGRVEPGALSQLSDVDVFHLISRSFSNSGYAKTNVG